MPARVIRLTPPTSSATFRARARARHLEAVLALDADDRVRWVELLREVEALDEQARTARRREEAIAAQQAERARRVAAIDRILALAGREAPDAG